LTGVPRNSTRAATTLDQTETWLPPDERPKEARASAPSGDRPDSRVAAASNRLLQNMTDYTAMTFALLWQRQAIFLAAAILTAFFFDPVNALIFYVVILLCEVQDLMIGRRVKRLKPGDHAAIGVCFVWIMVNTILSATAISLYSISVALEQTTGGHFTPLFFLFAAALFAAMNNHQVLWALVIRLTIYGISFLFIVVRDIWVERPDLSSELWLQFFTVIFVMYFLIDCSIVFLKLYRRNLAHLDRLREEHERTKAAYVVKSQFVSTVSHELRTPLTSIKGSLDLINSGALGPVPEKMRSLLEMAGKNGLRLSNLIDDVLDLQKIEAGEMKFRSEVFDLRTLVGEAVASNQGLSERYRVTIEEVPPGDEPLNVIADEARLMQVLSNMISNAAKFSSDGGTVRAGCARRGDMARIYVQDDGIGIPDHARDKVFERFSQVDSSDERHVGGTGLGMNISKEIVEQFGGEIDFVSEVGVGTTFFVDLPLADRAAD
jgi:signal transduction histidine kinase